MTLLFQDVFVSDHISRSVTSAFSFLLSFQSVAELSSGYSVQMEVKHLSATTEVVTWDVAQEAAWSPDLTFARWLASF